MTVGETGGEIKYRIKNTGEIKYRLKKILDKWAQNG